LKVKKTDLQSNLAMMIVLVSGTMLFMTLFMGYAIYRTSATYWPPLGIPKIGLAIPFISTLVIIASSWFAYQVKILVKLGLFEKAHIQLNMTLVLGTTFLMTQSYLWYHMKSTGVYVETSGIFGSVIYGFTWIHAVHMVLGLCALLYLKIVLKPNTVNFLQKTINVEKFWHFLGVIWIIMFLTLFVL
jgi:cytochrome c oxidase subunit 3